MKKRMLLDGVCLKPTPEVERFLFQLDDTRNALAQHKIAASKDQLVPGENYDISVKLGKNHTVYFTCFAKVNPTVEIFILDYEESFDPKPKHKRTFPTLVTAGAGVALTILELLYYGGHLQQQLAECLQTLSRFF